MPIQSGEWQLQPESSRTFYAVVAVAIACAGYSYFYTPWRLPPQLPFGTFGLIVGGDVLPLLVVPLLVARFGLSIPLRRIGFRWPGLARFAGATSLAYLAALPVVLWLASRPEFQAFYPSPAFPPAREHTLGLLALWLLHHAPQLFATEFCLRGFLFLPSARHLGLARAVIACGGLYVLLHASKPPLELLLAGWGGAVFMIAAWRTGSFLPAFAAHWLVAVTMDWLCLMATRQPA